MEVKDRKVSDLNLNKSQQFGSSKQRSARATLSGVSVKDAQSSRSDINIRISSKSETQTVRSSANSVIDLVNNVSDATAQIDQLVKSLGGILEQASGNQLPERRAQALENEANQLVSKIKELAGNSSKYSTSASQDSTLRSQVEAKLGKPLEQILPSEITANFGIENVNLTQQDSVLQTLKKVKEARDTLDKIQKQATQAKDVVADFLSSQDVAEQNSASAESSIRDVDQAVKLASNTRSTIFNNPDQALSAVGNVEDNSLKLLK